MSASRTRRPGADAAPAAPLRGTVLYVHGLWLTGVESFLLRRRLAENGWRLRVLPYSSIGERPESIASRCAREARRLAAGTDKPVHLLGHSLGGLILHRMFAMGLLEPDRFSGDFCRVVFLGSPVAGTRCGRDLAAWRFGPRLLGLAGTEELLDRKPRRWEFAAQLGVIAGNRPLGLGRLVTTFDEDNDGTVAVDETRIAGAKAHLVLPVNHSGLLIDADVARQTARFFEHGAFD